jgi:hypothetical protein
LLEAKPPLSMKKLTVLLFLVLSSSFLFAQPWGQLKQGEMTIGGIGDDRATSMVQTSDYGYVMLGSTTSFGVGAYVVKLDLAGNIQWTKVIDSIQAGGIIQTSDGGYAIIGQGQTSSVTKIVFTKLSSLGNIQWTKILESGNSSYTVLYGYSLVQNSNNSYTILGSEWLTCGTCLSVLQVITIDSAGNNEYIRNGNSGAYQYWHGVNIIKTTNKGYLVSGYGVWSKLKPYPGPSSDLIKIDSTGKSKWGVALEDSVSGYADSILNMPQINSIILTKDSGIAAVGFNPITYSNPNYEVSIIKLNSAGNIKWSRIIGGAGDDEAMSVVEANDGGYVMAGYTNSFGAGGYDVYVVKVDSVGNIVWTRTIGGKGNDYGESIVKCNDGGFAVAGYTDSYGAGGYDLYFIKLDSLGNLCSSTGTGGTITHKDSAFVHSDTTELYFSPNANSVLSNSTSINESYGGGGTSICSIVSVNNILLPNNLITVSPNPSNGKFTFQSSVVSQKSSVEVYNVLGEQVYSQYSLPNTQYQIDLTNQPNGVYFYRVLSDGMFVGSGKLVIQ